MDIIHDGVWGHAAGREAQILHLVWVAYTLRIYSSQINYIILVIDILNNRLIKY